MMYIKGEFMDVLKKEGKIIEDRAWKSNRIVPDFGCFLCALMKKDFHKDSNNAHIGIEYIAVGCSSNNNSGNFQDFKDMVRKFFENVKPNTSEWDKPYHPDDSKQDNWVWAKKIEDNKIEYLSSDNKIDLETVTNTLKITVTFDKNIPDYEKSLKFEEFALLGYHEQGTKTNKDTKIFFVNYATHGTITKEPDMTLTRTIKLTFPIN